MTLAGAGGCGKTRLAIRVASELLGKFRDGVYLAELGAVAEPKLVWSAVAAAMSAAEEPGKALARTMVERIGEHRMLLVLDNCEHLLESCGTVAQTLLESCPNLKVLATSREALGIGGEAAWRVPSLSIPPAPDELPATGMEGSGVERYSTFESVQLFVERAAAAQAGFALTPENAPAVAAICRRLDGIPLAIELAAARVRLFDVEQINQKLDDRFLLLTGGSRTALERHQTLRATIDWSYGLLSPAERRLLRALAVFAGGWTLEAAEAVCAEERAGPRKGGRATRSR